MDPEPGLPQEQEAGVDDREEDGESVGVKTCRVAC